MTELELRIIEKAKLHTHRLYYWDKVHLNRIASLPADTELAQSDKLRLEQLGKAFGLVPKTPAEVESDRRNRMKRFPGPGPLKPSSRRRRRF